MMAGLVRGIGQIGLASVKVSSSAFLKRAGAPAFVRVANAATFGGGLAGGWALAREGSNPSPSASRKPAFIRPHTYTMAGRRQAGLISELPRRVLLGNSEGKRT